MNKENEVFFQGEEETAVLVDEETEVLSDETVETTTFSLDDEETEFTETEWTMDYEEEYYEEDDLLHGTYILYDEIGQGSMGRVYKAYHTHLKKYVVIKFIKKKYIGKTDTRKEADILKNLHHPYIPQIFDYFEDIDEDGNLAVYSVIDFIPGKPMDALINEGYVFSGKEIYKYICQLTDAIKYLHSRDIPIIHGDIKPGNIIITDTGDLCLIDFNISGSTDGESIQGYTRSYAAPEQVQNIYNRKHGKPGIEPDGRTDIYSLGATFYRLITGMKANLDYREQSEIPEGVYDIPDGLVYVINRAIRIRRDERFESAEEMSDALADMAKKDSRYKKMIKRRSISLAFMIILLVLSLLVTFRGYKGIQFEKAEANCKKACELYKASRFDESYDFIMDEALDKEKIYSDGQLSELYYIAGDDAFMEGRYDEAISLYDRSLEYNSENSNVYCDCAISCIRAGDREKAKMLMEEAEKHSLSDSKIYLIKAELAADEKKKLESKDYFEKSLEAAEDVEEKSRIYMFYSDMYEDIPTYDSDINLVNKDIAILERFFKEDISYNRNLALRKKAKAFALKGNLNSDSISRKKALETYEEILKIDETPAVYINMAILYEEMGEFNKARELYNMVSDKYGETYEIYKRLAFLSISEQMEKEGDKDYSAFVKAYKQCMKQVQSEGIDRNSDPELLKLDSLYKTYEEYYK